MFLPPGFSIASNGQIYSSDGRGPYPFSEAGFFFGRRRQASKDLTLPASQKILLKLTVGVDSLLRHLGATLDNGHAKITLFRDGITSVPFPETLVNRATNWTEEVPEYTSLNSVVASVAGSPTISAAVFVDSLRIKTANQANQSQSVSGSLLTELGLGQGAYFILIENIGSGAVEGIFQLLWEEVPNG